MGRATRIAYAVLEGLGFPGRRRRRSDRAVCFCYHNIVADEEAGAVGDRSLHLGATTFQAHLEWVRSSFDVIPLSELFERLTQGRSLQGLACLTFDDGYTGVFDHALPALAQIGLPATVFLVADAIGSQESFWWDRLGELSALDQTTRFHCRDALQGDPRLVADAFPGEPSLPGSLFPAPWDRIEKADPSIAFGSHSLTHRNLTTISSADLRRELAESREILADRVASWVDLISYPYGCVDEHVAGVAREVGYRGGLALSFGSIAALPASDPYRLIRINVPSGLPVQTLSCWSAGLRWNPPV